MAFKSNNIPKPANKQNKPVGNLSHTTPPKTATQFRIDVLKQRIAQPGKQPNASAQLQNLKGKQFLQQQLHQELPFDAAYDTTVNDAQNIEDQTMAGLAGRRLALSQSYGIGDDSNPYSQARQLETSYAQKRAGTLNSAAGAGQLYSGSTQNAFNAARAGFGASQDALLRNYESDQAGLTQKGTDAQNTFIRAKDDAMAQRLQNAVNATPDYTEASIPKSAKHYLQKQQRKAHNAAQAGHKQKAQKIRQRIARLS